MQSIETSSYQIHFNSLAMDALSDHLSEKGYSKVFILVDENTRRDCLPLLHKKLKGCDTFELIQIPAGEAYKNIASCETVWQILSDKGADRKSLLINLGGGVLTDLGGFVASTFKRGIAFINIPTTLLAMVDASVGGKTGVDLGPLKNQIGIINQPEMVLIVDQFLHTLDPRQMRSGFAEMLKHGLIQSKSYWRTLNKLESPMEAAPYIFESVHIKNRVVMQDPREDNLRKILNYGHTLGHAIESHFLDHKDSQPLLHGEAIAIGMILEAYLSHKLCGLKADAMAEIKEGFLRRFPAVSIGKDDRAQILELLKFDKKNSYGHINFVLLEDIGKPAIDVRVPFELFDHAFAYYME